MAASITDAILGGVMGKRAAPVPEKEEPWANAAQVEAMNQYDPINHPRHYTSHPARIECIDVVEHMPFNRGCAIKYLWRCGLKGDPIEDLQKAKWYVEREIARLQREREAQSWSR